MTDVEWRDVPGYEGLYRVSSDGRVSGTRRKGSAGGLLRPARDPGGRLYVQLCRGGVPKVTHVHRIVALAFYGPLPDGLETRHLDGDQSNNRVENLRYGTHLENEADKIGHGTHHNGSKTECAYGHPFDVANTYVMPGASGRQCRPCRRRRNREYYARLRQAAVQEDLMRAM